MYHPLKLSTIEATIAKQQTGSTSEMTLPEQIEFLDGEIHKAQGWIEYYKQPRARKYLSADKTKKMIETYAALVDGFATKREVLLAKLYASQMPDIGGAFVLAEAQS